MINLKRIKRLVLSPASEWSVIADEPESVTSTIKDYLIYLLALSALLAFLNLAVIGQGFLFASYKMAMGAALAHAIGGAISSLIIAWLLAWAVSALAPSFRGSSDRTAAFRLVAYSMTVPVLSQILGLIPLAGSLLGFVGALYGVYVFYLGMSPMMKNPREKSVLYVIASIFAAMVIAILVTMVMGWFLPKPTGELALSGPGGEMTIGTERLDSIDKRLEAFTRKMEAANNSGDPQLAAKTALESLAGLVGGKDGQTRKPLAPGLLKEQIPEQMASFSRTQFSTETNKVLGFEVTSARADYESGEQSLSVEITDMGAAAALASMVSWAATESEKQTDSSIEKTYREGKRVINETSRRDGSLASYKIMLANGVVVNATGRNMSLGQLLAAIDGLDLDGLESAQ